MAKGVKVGNASRPASTLRPMIYDNDLSKQSGLGREGACQGIEDYVEIKYLCLGDVLK